MADRLPFEYVDGCTGPYVDLDIVPAGLPICTGPTFEDPDVYVTKIDFPDVMPPPCVTPGSDPEDQAYTGMWAIKGAASSGKFRTHIDVLDTDDETTAGKIQGKDVCTGATYSKIQDDVRDVPVPPAFRAGDPTIKGITVLRYKRIDGPPVDYVMDPFLEDVPPNTFNIKVMTEQEYADAVVALTVDQTLTILGTVYTETSGGDLKIQQDQHGDIRTAFGGDCGGECESSVLCKITAGYGPTYTVDVYGNGPSAPATETGKLLWVIGWVVLDPIGVGTWVAANPGLMSVTGDSP